MSKVEKKRIPAEIDTETCKKERSLANGDREETSEEVPKKTHPTPF